MIDMYGAKVGARRWPMVVFYTMVDIGALNGLLVFKEANPKWIKKFPGSSRRKYLRELGMPLIKPEVQRRSHKLDGFSESTRQAMEQVLGVQANRNPSTPRAVPSWLRRLKQIFLI